MTTSFSLLDAYLPFKSRYIDRSVSQEPLYSNMPRPQEDPDVRNSKTLAYILRHGAEKEGLYIRSDGFIKLADVVRLFFSSSFPSSARVLKLCFFDFHVFSVIASPSNHSSSYPPKKTPLVGKTKTQRRGRTYHPSPRADQR